jgi:hypothetical protein
MNILQRLFNRSKSSYQVDSDVLNTILNENTFLNNEIKFDFYERLLQIILGGADKNNPAYPRLYDEINKAIHALVVYFENVLKSGLSQESLEIFCSKHEEILNKKYEFPVINGLLSTFWFQIIRKLRDETQKSDNLELKQRFDPCFIKLELVSRKVFGF